MAGSVKFSSKSSVVMVYILSVEESCTEDSFISIQ